MHPRGWVKKHIEDHGVKQGKPVIMQPNVEGNSMKNCSGKWAAGG